MDYLIPHKLVPFPTERKRTEHIVNSLKCSARKFTFGRKAHIRSTKPCKLVDGSNFSGACSRTSGLGGLGYGHHGLKQQVTALVELLLFSELLELFWKLEIEICVGVLENLLGQASVIGGQSLNQFVIGPPTESQTVD
uniref:Uncharacterized protein n=1 Tax=Romanomermis culicivorax TaxID=13658 RepID=A0A915J7R1_ROMCU